MRNPNFGTYFVELNGSAYKSDPVSKQPKVPSPAENAEAIKAFKANLPKFLQEKQLPPDAVIVVKEYERFGLILVECAEDVSELLKQMPCVDSVRKNGTKRASW